MKTSFSVRIPHSDASHAFKFAGACFQRIDEIENQLSRYVPGSDVWRINHLKAGESTFLCDDTYQCLRIALEVTQMTDGIFDITIGRQIEHLKNKSSGATPALSGVLALAPDRPLVQCVESGREIDLGGIGKGYALEQLRRLAEDWGLTDILFSAGASTHLAIGEHAWPITLSESGASRVFDLIDGALSVSSDSIQGSHIVNPQSGDLAEESRTVWVHHPNAAIADALSTALYAIDEDTLRALIEEHTDTRCEPLSRSGEGHNYFVDFTGA